MSVRVMVIMLSVWAGVAAQVQAGKHVEEVGHPPMKSDPVVIMVDPHEAMPCGKPERARDFRSCLGRLRQWLCYRPPVRPGDCCSKHQPVPCCRVPVYAFFLHRCRECAHDHYKGEVIPIGYSYSDQLHHRATQCNWVAPCNQCK